MSTLTIREHILSFFPNPIINTGVISGESETRSGSLWKNGQEHNGTAAKSSGILRLGLGSLHLNVESFSITVCTLILAYAITRITYNLYFHPLAGFPGPKLAAISYIYRFYTYFTGEAHKRSFALHEKYGSIVRAAPNELSFGTPSLYKGIHAYHRGGDPSEHGQLFRKSKKYIINIDGKVQPKNILTERDPGKHQAKRRRIGNAFSTRALSEQEGLITRWIDLLVTQIGKFGEGGKKPLDMAKWYNMATFDIIGDLSFGEEFGSLEMGDTHHWVSLILRSIKLGGLLGQLQEFPWLDRALKGIAKPLIPKKLVQARKQHLEYAKQKAMRRMNLETNRKDFMSYILNENDAPPTVQEMTLECALLVVAGSETTATFLTGTTYLLLSNPKTYYRLVQEIRTAFPSYDSITYETTSQNHSKLPYLAAVIEEGLRMFPPAPGTFPRESPPEGAVVDGFYIPGGVDVYGCAYTLTRSSKFWHLPNEFIPDRWLDPPPPEFQNDQRDASNPFGLGPRACIGKNLAYMEMRLILCKILWRYDLELGPGSENWIERQKMFQLWEKSPLLVRFKESSAGSDLEVEE